MEDQESVFKDYVKGCATKSRYKDLSIAETEKKKSEKKYGQFLYIYFCKHCLGYHLTSRHREDLINTQKPEITRSVAERNNILLQQKTGSLKQQLGRLKMDLHNLQAKYDSLKKKREHNNELVSLKKEVSHLKMINSVLKKKIEEKEPLKNVIENIYESRR